MKVPSKKRIRLATLLLGLLGLGLMHFYVPRTITQIKHPIISLFKSEHLKTHKPSYVASAELGKFISFQSFDDLTLNAFLRFAATENAKGTVLLLHGIRSSKEHYAELSEQLAARGYNAVAVDLRAHGQSEGTHCTFGVKEKKDISRLITKLLETEGVNENIGIWGQSLGGAVALQTLAIDKRLRFGIIESTFSRLNSTTHDYSSFHLGFDLKPLTNYLLHRAGKLADFDPREANPVEACRNVTQSILMVHGDKDQRISIAYGLENFEQLASKEKEFLTIEGANHLTVWQTQGEAYFEKAFDFIEKQRE